jgi:hypothetical protein
LLMTHILIMVIIPCVGTVLLLEGLSLALSQDTSMVHVSPVVVHVALTQLLRC